MEKVLEKIKGITLWGIGAFILAIGVTVITLACIFFIWDTQEVFAVKLGLTGMVVGVYGLFVMLVGISR